MTTTTTTTGALPTQSAQPTMQQIAAANRSRQHNDQSTPTPKTRIRNRRWQSGGMTWRAA